MRKCFRSIDKPQILFGLEAEDLAFIALGIGLGSLVFEPYIPGVLGIISWILLAKFKQGKPFGYMLHWLYNQGIDLPGHAPNPKRTRRYGAYGSNSYQKHEIY